MYISLDLETTGFDPTKDKIIEFGAVKFDKNGVIDQLSFLCNPGFPLPQVITHITKIKDSDLAGKPDFESQIARVQEFIGNYPIIGHNIEFDINFLKSFGVEIPGHSYDTQKLVSILIPSLPSYSLEVLTQIFELKHEEKHRALDDSIAAMELFLKAQQGFSELSPDLLAKIKEITSNNQDSIKFFFNEISTQINSNFSSLIKPAKITDTEEIKEYPEIKALTGSSIIDLSPPYLPLTKYLAQSFKKDCTIAIPTELFSKNHSELPAEISKIDTATSYISPRRLQEFCKKENLEEHELISALKYLVWLAQTKTGLLNEVTLFNKEKSTIYNVNCDLNFTNLNEEPFIKATNKESSVKIITHRQLIEHPQNTEQLIIIDFESFIRSLTNESSLYLRTESLLLTLSNIEKISSENEALQQLISKTTILIATLGIIFNKYNDNNLFSPRAQINHNIFTTNEWANFRSIFVNIIELSKLLTEIQNPQTQIHLKNWKRQLTEIHDFIKESEEESSLTWIESYNEEVVVRKTPLSITTPLHKILDHGSNYQLVGEGLDLKDNGAFIKQLYSLPANLPTFSMDTNNNNCTTHIVKDFREDINLLVRILKEKQNSNPGHLAVICNSKQTLHSLTLKLSELEVEILSQMTCSQGKINEKLKKDHQKSILLITQNTWNNIENPGFIDTIILIKLPFDPPSDPTLISLSKNLTDPFNQIQIPRTTLNLKKIINRLIQNHNRQKNFIILDNRIITKDYGESMLKNLPNTTVMPISSLLNILTTND